MVTISGNATKIKKENHKCPKDGIHRRKKSGRIRGFWAAQISGVHLFYGNWAYYFKSCSTDMGMKVFYSFKFNKTTKTEKETQITKDMMEHLEDFCPKIYYTDNVETDIRFGSRRCKAVSPVIYMSHVNYPEKAWIDFAKGKPYDWDADNHPAHSKVGFMEFRHDLEEMTKKIDYDFDSFSIGNIVWCTEKKRWFLVDVR